MTFADKSGLVDGGVVADAGRDILQDAPVMGVEQHVIGHDRWHACLMRQVRQFIQSHLVIGAAQQGERHVGAIGKSLFQFAKMQGAGIIRRVRDHDDEQALAPGDQVFPEQMAFPFAGSGLAKAQQTAKAAVSRAVGRIDQYWREISQVEATADDKPDAGSLRRSVCLHHACQGITVADTEGFDA
ncbi:hypothetical protein Amal_03397 [Acetobacter malorum]|uniref:Uncharacterized protein n=1 Tax=Acetobacter malorum TaxID=178901 RepID=A0A177G567_9PROT|nr:hypothetical protein Amal_03397 [Acetobacter malorum]